jgi:hypothetical protein
VPAGADERVYESDRIDGRARRRLLSGGSEGEAGEGGNCKAEIHHGNGNWLRIRDCSNFDSEAKLQKFYF